MRLTAKQKKFCDEYLITLNASDAAIKAGYSAATARASGHNNMQKPAIQEYIKKRMEQKESALIAGQNEVLKYLTSVLRGESITKVMIGMNEDGDPVMIDKPPDEKERLKAAELLGKRYALYTDKVNVDGTAKVVIIDDLGKK